MGVPGLWKHLEPACYLTTWSQLSEPGFVQPGGSRGVRLGIDVSAWLFHMGRVMTITEKDDDGNEVPVNIGANADLRLVFFRLCELLKHGFLLLFVFDGPKRPAWKRGARVGGQVFGGRSPEDLKRMFELMGCEWRVAPGEAEAELAEMNRRGEIDCVLSDDVDSFLFGVQKIVRNPSKTLSSNKSKTALARTLSETPPSQDPSQPSSDHLPVDPSYEKALPMYTAADVFAETRLGRDELILVALLAGGDYLPSGFNRAGSVIALALAEGGYGKQLLDGVRQISASPGQAGMSTFLTTWRESVAEELRSNASGLLSRRNMKLADELAQAKDFPSLAVIEDYLHPAVSPASTPAPTWSSELDLAGLVAFCQSKFEWGNADIVARMRSLVWLPLGIAELRRAALARDGHPSAAKSRPLLPPQWVKSVSERKAAPSTDYVPSYRVELDPRAFDPLIEAALPSIDPWPYPDYARLSPFSAEEAKADRKSHGRGIDPPKPPTTSSYRHWVAAGFASPQVAGEDGELCRAVRAWEEERDRRAREKEEAEERRRERAALRANASGSGSGRKSPTKSPSKSQSRSPSKKGKKVDDEDSDAELRRWLEAEKAKKARERLVKGMKGKGKGKGMEREVGEDEGQATKRRSFLDESASDGARSSVSPPPPFASTSSGLSRRVLKPSSSSALPSSQTVRAPSSDLEIISAPSTSTSTRRPPAKKAPSPLTDAFRASKSAITSAFPASKPAASKSRAKKPPAVHAASSDSDDLFSPAASPRKPPPSPRKKRVVRDESSASPPRSPILSSTEEDDGETRRKVAHVAKAGRTSAAQRSPTKTRAVPPTNGHGTGQGKGKKAETITLDDSSDEGVDSAPERAPSRSPVKCKGKGKELQPRESIEEFWAKRKAQQDKKAREKKTGVVELSDSD
ncbi:hypothetical protein JCM10207_004573 [Rhodosporidiobolus poonsookiae]